MRTAIGIDIGGTNIKGVLLNEAGDVLQQHYIPTNDDADGNWQKSVIEMFNVLRSSSNSDVAVAGVSAPGLADENNSCITYLPNRLTGIENLIWESMFAVQTCVLNDAHAALLAEAKYGTLQGCRDAVLLTLGTGVGGGILINGELYQGQGQMAGHFGHTCIALNDDERSIVGMPGSLEYALGNYSVKRRSYGRFGSTLELVKGYEEHQPFATWLWLNMIRKLALTIASLANSLSPQVVVLAGGITQAGDSLLKPLQEFLSIYEYRPNNKCIEVKLAKFTDLSGAIGAAAFAFSKLEKKIK